MKDIKDYSLLHHNTFGIDERCRRFVEFTTTEELKDILCSLTDEDRPLLLLGGGSNLLLTGTFPGTVLHSAIRGIECTPAGDGVVDVRCGSGEVVDDVIAHTLSLGLYGMENLSIIPGEVGASAVQNIGAYGVEAKDIIYKVEALEVATGREVTFTNADCEYAYRQSRFKHDWKDQYVITYVTYRLSTTFVPKTTYGNIQSELDRLAITTPTADDIRRVIIDIRNAKLPDPAVQGNAGSFFMNPIVPRAQFEALLAQYPSMPHYHVDDDHEKIPAGWMIDQCGLKGFSLGPAAVHDRQALVLVNNGGAKGQDIVSLCRYVQQQVLQKFHIQIHPEVNFL